MRAKHIFEIILWTSILFLFKWKLCNADSCDRRPLGTKTAPLPPDNQFLVEIHGLIDNLYIPKNQYIVRLKSRDTSPFIAFTISLKEDTMPNRNNPRRPTLLNPGRLELMPNSTNTKFSYNCSNTIIESDITAKTFVEALWTAPDKDNKCVTIFAVVAVRPNVWYNYEGPLSKRVCEDRRKADDMQPLENNDCRACEDARYQLMFEGMWSYNTHPRMFPELARFSDVVGASHSKDFSLYKYTSEASVGLKMLAEQGNTTKLELEIQEKLGKSVRTVLKATAPSETNMGTVTSFRATQEHHLVSIATALLPSPDWFLGVANLELCDVKTHRWAESIRLNLYPMDAGTDKGLDFNSPNEEMSPPQPISPAVIVKDIPKEQIKPFARLQLDLVRTYSKPGCITDTEDTTTTDETREASRSEKFDISSRTDTPAPVPQTTTTEAPPSVDPDSTEDCPMTTWEDWMPCEGECVDGKVTGVQLRLRYHMVDGVAVGKYVEGEPSADLEVPEECLNNYPVSDAQMCEETCEENNNEEEQEEDEDDEEAAADARSWDLASARQWGW